MPSRLGKRKDYNLVDDAYDSRVPVHNEDAFRHGINFKAKYIGTLDVPRPTGRMEIVVAMRRIRYEFKAKSVKKRKVNIRVSTEGVRVTLRKKKKKQEWAWDLNRMLIMHDPIYRIFYVSHDSHDLKIWSYIARDGASNVFRCNVFKSPKKSLAMHIVRTIGQAFEVCHKLNIGPPSKKDDANSKEKIKSSDDEAKDKTDGRKQDETQKTTPTDSIPSNGEIDLPKSPPSDEPGPGVKETLVLQSASEPISIQAIDSKTPLSAHHQLQLSQQKILQAEQQTEVAVAQVHLLKDQLAAETTARIEAQARNHQLLLQNRDLLQQMNELVARLAEAEAKLIDTTSDIPSLTLSKVVVDATTPASGAVQDPALSGVDLTKISPFVDTGLYENTNTSAQMRELPNGANGMLTAADTSTSTITKSSMGSGSVRAKRNKGDGGSSSSESSSEDEETVGGPVRLASESGTVKNAAVDKTKFEANGSATKDQTGNTSIWTSGLATPERILSGQGYQQTISFNDTSLTTAANESNLSNGYTLSPIFTTGGKSDPHSSFQHFSITEADSSLRIVETPKSALKKSFSASTNMNEKKYPSSSFQSGGDQFPQTQINSYLLWTQATEKQSPVEDSFHVHEIANKSSDAIMTPKLDPPPSKVRRVPSVRTHPEYRPRPETHLPDPTVSPARDPKVIMKGVESPKLVDTSDSDLEIPLKSPKYNQGVKMSQSSHAYGSDPLLSRFDPLLMSKSKSFDLNSPVLQQRQTSNVVTTALSPVRDVDQSNPFMYITPRTPESSKYCNPVNPDELSKSYGDLDQPLALCVSGVFTSPEEYQARLRYEPLKKQQASEWHRTSKTTETRLNSSFHAGDKEKDSRSKIESPSHARDALPVYRTYSDLPSTVTPQKSTVSASVQEKLVVEATVHTIASLNTNNNNSKGNRHDRAVAFTEPPSLEGNISLLDDLLISESEDKNASGSLYKFNDFTSLSSGKNIEQPLTPFNHTEESSETAQPAESSFHSDEPQVTLAEMCETAPKNEPNPTLTGSNSDSGVSGCGGSKHEVESSTVEFEDIASQ